MSKQVGGYTIRIERERTLGGWEDIHYSCFRNSDKFEVCSGVGSLIDLAHKSSVRAYIMRRIRELESLEVAK